MNETDDKFNADQQQAYLDWLPTRERAMATGRAEDARLSALAFAKFLYTFVENSQRPSEKVIPFPRRVPDGDAA